MNSFTLVENIINPNSVSRIIDGLSKINNISNVSVIAQLGKVSFRFEEYKINMEVIQKLEELGFPQLGK